MSEPTSGSSGRDLNFLFLIGLVLAILVIVFAIQNAETTTVKFFSFSVSPPTALLIVGCILAGSMLTLIFSLPGWIRRKKRVSTLQLQLKELRRHYEELAAARPGATPRT